MIKLNKGIITNRSLILGKPNMAANAILNAVGRDGMTKWPIIEKKI